MSGEGGYVAMRFSQVFAGAIQRLRVIVSIPQLQHHF